MISSIHTKRDIIKPFINSIVLFFILFVISGCSGLEKSEKSKVRKINVLAEPIYRLTSDHTYLIPPPKSTPRQLYPWEERFAGGVEKISKEYFRCKGSSLNSPYMGTQGDAYLFDCEGGHAHSLPLQDGVEMVYPILIDVLNYIQDQTSRSVIITCGHRCPAHNAYSDPSVKNSSSKHTIGAEVDFYVEGLQNEPQKIVRLIEQYYSGTKEFGVFTTYDGSSNVSTPPICNKELFVKISLPHEGRDKDNTHPYPYITLQVRYDRHKKEKVNYSWEAANKNFKRT